MPLPRPNRPPGHGHGTQGAETIRWPTSRAWPNCAAATLNGRKPRCWKAANLTASEALEANVIDFIARGLDDALGQWWTGSPSASAARDVVIDTSEANIELIEPDWRYELLGIITDPNVAYILLMIGIYGLILEFYSPRRRHRRGSRRDLPVARRFRIADAAHQLRRPRAVDRRHRAVGGGGVFAQLRHLRRGGVVAFVVGSIILMDTDLPGYQISAPLIAAAAILSLGVLVFALGAALRSRKMRDASGKESMVGGQGRGGGCLHRHGPSARLRGGVAGARAAWRRLREGWPGDDYRRGRPRADGGAHGLGSSLSLSSRTKRLRTEHNPMILTSIIVAAILAILASAFRVLREYERAVVFLLGPLPKRQGAWPHHHHPRAPADGACVDLRTIVMDVPTQDLITRDNVSVRGQCGALLQGAGSGPCGAHVDKLHGGRWPARANHIAPRCLARRTRTRQLLAEREQLNPEHPDHLGSAKPTNGASRSPASRSSMWT